MQKSITMHMQLCISEMQVRATDLLTNSISSEMMHAYQLTQIMTNPLLIDKQLCEMHFVSST